MKKFAAQDLYLHRTITSLKGAHAHGRLAFQVGRALRKQDAYERTLSVLEDGDAGPRRMTTPLHGASSPAWNADGSVLAFLSQRTKAGMQVHLLQMQGGEAQGLTDSGDLVLKSIEQWTPGDDALLVLASAPWREDGEPEPPKGERQPGVARFLPYKLDGDGIIVSERTHLYRVDAATGDIKSITSGDFDVSLAAMSKDGSRIAYVRNRTARQRHRLDVWTSAADGTDAALLVDQLASVNAVAWSGDGRWLALIGSREEGDSRAGVWLADSRDGSLRQLGGEDFEVDSAGGVHWHTDGERLVVVSAHRSLQQLAVVHPADDRIERFGMGLRHVQAVSCWGARIAFVVSSMRRPEEVCSVDWSGGDMRRHTALNRGWTSKRLRPRVLKRRFEVPDGTGGLEKIDAWVLLPADAKPPYPLLVDMHGGPHSAVLVDYAAHAYWYVLASRGWAVVAPNAVGSHGFGRAFSERLRGQWGKLDLPQFESVIQRLQDDGLADDRIVCSGKSYGGFLSAWAIGHSPVFKAAVVCAPVSNIGSHYGTSDSGFYVTPYAMGGEFPDCPEVYDALSPVRHAHRATVPTLILQGENDGRCPRGQSEELFATLIRSTDVPVELVVYPTSTHAEAEKGRPSNRVDYHSRIADWARRWGDSANNQGVAA